MVIMHEIRMLTQKSKGMGFHPGEGPNGGLLRDCDTDESSAAVLLTAAHAHYPHHPGEGVLLILVVQQPPHLGPGADAVHVKTSDYSVSPSCCRLHVLQWFLNVSLCINNNP